MGRKHAFAISALLAVAAVAGAYATMQTLDLGAAASEVSVVPDRVIAQREKKLDDWEKALKTAAKKKPPKLPAVPTFAPVVIPEVPLDLPSPGAAASPPSPPANETPAAGALTPPAETIYVQPDPIITYVQDETEPGSSRDEHEEKEQVKALTAPLEAQIDGLKAQEEQLKAQEESLKLQVEQLKAQVEQLKAQADQLEGVQKEQFKAQQIEPLEAQIDGLKAQVEQLKAQKESLKVQVEQLKKQIEQIRESVYA